MADEHASTSQDPGDAGQSSDDSLLVPAGDELLDQAVSESTPDEGVVLDHEAEELAGDPVEDETPDEADPDDVQIDDESQLDEATEVAAQARSTRPVKRNQTVAPVRKAGPTAKRDQHAASRRTTPALFVRQSVGELKKVKWPTADQVRQYFIVVLIFVLLIMAVVGVLDFVFSWLLIKSLG